MANQPKLNLILDSRRQEKYEPLMDELRRQKIDSFEIWPCLMFNDIPSSINASHKMIVRDAKEKGLDECCIGEDDLMFPHENGWNYFLENKPNEYDIYAAGNYLAFQRPENKGAMKVDCIVGFHLYLIHSKYYDTFLSTPDNQHIDTAQKGNLFVCYPFAALQRIGWSANNKTITNYNSILKPEDIFQ